jgi:hypothetical protein
MKKNEKNDTDGTENQGGLDGALYACRIYIQL